MKKKMKAVKVEDVKFNHFPDVGDMVNDVHAYRVNPNRDPEPTADDLDCSKLEPETIDRRFI